MERWTLADFVAENCTSPVHCWIFNTSPKLPGAEGSNGYTEDTTELDDSAHDILFRTRNVVEYVPG